MEAVQAQIRTVVDELNTLRNEIVTIKSAHAGLHQSAVEANTGHNQAFREQAGRLDEVESRITQMAQRAQLP